MHNKPISPIGLPRFQQHGGDCDTDMNLTIGPKAEVVVLLGQLLKSFPDLELVEARGAHGFMQKAPTPSASSARFPELTPRSGFRAVTRTSRRRFPASIPTNIT
ncbi:MAG: hypothetical protein WBD95_12615 [Xanthobacteraceae bacterium]